MDMIGKERNAAQGKGPLKVLGFVEAEGCDHC
jgi:hypothetical protein